MSPGAIACGRSVGIAPVTCCDGSGCLFAQARTHAGRERLFLREGEITTRGLSRGEGLTITAVIILVRVFSARFCSIRLGSIRFDSIRFDSIRFGSIRFVSFRLG